MKDGRCYECSFVFDVFVIQYLRVLFRKREEVIGIYHRLHAEDSGEETGQEIKMNCS